MISSHDINSPDPYLRPVFSNRDKIRRYCWELTWLLLCNWTPKPFHNWRIFILRLFGAKIGASNSIYPTCKIWAPWRLETGDVVAIGPDADIYNPAGVKVGHHCVISQHAFICGATHNYNSVDFDYIMEQTVLEPYVWICARAILLPGVKCSEGSVLAAGAVASKNLEAWTVYAGNPAKAVKSRNNFTLSS